jgi:hypothetical protein
MSATGTNPDGSDTSAQSDGTTASNDVAIDALSAYRPTGNAPAHLRFLNTGELGVASPFDVPSWARPGRLVPNTSSCAVECLGLPSDPFKPTIQRW